jgi:hypothetical protein
VGLRFLPCPACARHVKCGDRVCPFCAASVPEAALCATVVSARMSRSALFAAGAMGASIAITSCANTNTTYGVPPYFLEEDQSSPPPWAPPPAMDASQNEETPTPDSGPNDESPSEERASSDAAQADSTLDAAEDQPTVVALYGAMVPPAPNDSSSPEGDSTANGDARHGVDARQD